MAHKQTPVDWLVEKLNQCEPWYSGTFVTRDHINRLIEIAKEKEVEEDVKFVEWIKDNNQKLKNHTPEEIVLMYNEGDQ